MAMNRDYDALLKYLNEITITITASQSSEINKTPIQIP